MAALLLEPSRVVETIERLTRRIKARFPGSGLSQLANDLLSTAQSAAQRAATFSRPIVAIRLLTWLLVALLTVAITAAVTAAGLRWRHVELPDLIQVSEAGLNEAVLIGAGLFFLIGAERRLKRARALRAIHELRSMAHIIDMHQLTKDPERLLNRYSSTVASPLETLDAFQLSRYLDYCSELLSLTGKVAAIYVQRFDDPVVLESVAEIEDLTTGLCQKIWQKLHLVQKLEGVTRQPDSGSAESASA